MENKLENKIVPSAGEFLTKKDLVDFKSSIIRWMLFYYFLTLALIGITYWLL